MRLFFLTFLIGSCLYPAVNRPPAPWPPPSGVIRVIIDTDAGAEIDDQYALSLALGSRGRIRLEGIVGAYFGDFGGPTGASKSVAEIERVLAKAGLSGTVPIKSGATPFVFLDRPPESDGVRFIIDKARVSSPENPLWVVSLGPATDVAAALSIDPGIADRMIVVWHGRTQWPLRCWNYNVWNDPKAARLLFSLPCRLILFDTGDHLTASLEETGNRLAPLGPLGAYLQQIRSKSPSFLLPTKSMFDLGDLTALVDPQAVQWERVEAPAVDYDLRYDFSKKMGSIVRIYYIDRDRAFNDLVNALRTLPSAGGK